MKSLPWYAFMLFIVLSSGWNYAFAQDQAPTATAAKESPRASKVAEPVTTSHTLKIDGETLKYTATAGFLPLKDDSGKLEANMFFVAYLKQNGSGSANRPLTFAFNGGPGASSIWLHLGALGPRRVVLANNGTALPEKDKLIDNEYTWLDFTDLVFVDPVGTGYSRAAEGVNADQFYSVEGDIHSNARFIREYITRYQRWMSPKFIAGESYGTTRAAGLSKYLQIQMGINLKGLVLLSSVLNFQTISYQGGNDLPYVLALPSLTAAAFYHKKLSTDLQADFLKTMNEVQDWAANSYFTALGKGDQLPDSERKDIVAKLAAYTGLPESYIKTSKLRISTYRFIKELLRDEDQSLGLLDSRVKSYDISPTGEYERFDPAMFLVTGPFVAPFNEYIRKDLKFVTPIPYKFLSMSVNEAWKWDIGGQGYLNVAERLAEAMTLNDHLKVFTGSGYFDLTTPFASQKYTYNHLGINPELRANMTHIFYPSGHQIYTDIPSLKKLKSDVAGFYQASAASSD
ncbi:MAG: peptidase S10 [Calditrichia bacterium]